MKKKSRKRRAKQEKPVLRLLRREPPLGGSTAEKEPDLSAYFVERDKLVGPVLKDPGGLHILVGPKGAGKSAVLQYALQNREVVPAKLITVRPQKLALWSAIEADLADAYDERYVHRQLWMFLFVSQMYHQEYGDDVTGGWNWLKEKLGRHPSDFDRIKRLLKKASGDTTLTEAFLGLFEELNFEVSAKAKGGVAEAAVKSSGKLAKSSRSQLLSDLHHLAEEIPKHIGKSYLFVIDDLDYDWSSKAPHRLLLSRLFDAMLHLSRYDQIGFLVALREDIFNELLIEDPSKLRDQMQYLSWSTDKLKQLIQKRVAWSAGLAMQPLPDLGRLFVRTEDAADLWRCAKQNPRRAIQLVERCIRDAGEHPRIPAEVISSVVREQSRRFLVELDQSYATSRPGLKKIAAYLKAREFGMSDAEDLQNRLYSGLQERDLGKHAPWLHDVVHDRNGLLDALLRTDLLWWKDSKGRQARRYKVETDEVGEETWFSVNPAFAPGLNLPG